MSYVLLSTEGKCIASGPSSDFGHVAPGERVVRVRVPRQPNHRLFDLLPRWAWAGRTRWATTDYRAWCRAQEALR